MSKWCLTYNEFKPEEEGLREALCTLGNGYFATRGAGEESHDDKVHYPGTYVAGLYNRLSTEIKDKNIENESLVNIPNWLCFTFRVSGGNWFNLSEVEILSYKQQLDLKKGILTRQVKFRDNEGRETNYQTRRIVHMENAHYAAVQIEITALNWSGDIEIKSAINGQVKNNGVERYGQLADKHLEQAKAELVNEETILLQCKTNQSHVEIAEAVRTQIFYDGKKQQLKREIEQQDGYISQIISFDIAQHKTLTAERVMSLYTSKDSVVSEAGLQAGKDVVRAEDYSSLEASHVKAWEIIWRWLDVELELNGNGREDYIQMVLHLYSFHIIQTTSRHSLNLDAGVPSRGWHGEAYRGHILWDELFIFPFLNIRMPDITRSLLLYRYNRLPEARAAAKAAGYRGAMFPWQSGSNGREESQNIHLNPKSGRWIPDNSNLQRHVNAAIAYNVWQYYQSTEDTNFLYHYGAEMIWEIARFWASKTTYNPKLDRYEIHNVMGPDEFHDAYPNSDQPGIHNNSYTNLMVVWIMNKALKLFEILPNERIDELFLMMTMTPDEKQHWQDISKKMKVAFHDDGIISQFEGYDQLKELDWDKYRDKYDNIQRLDRILEAENDSVNNYKASKQADVLMLFYLFSSEQLGKLFKQLGYDFDYATIPKNIEYYINRTSHGSTLSWIVNSWVLSRADRSGSWELFEKALKSDIADIQGGTTKEGIHLGAMAGTVDLVQRGYTGLETREDVLFVNPQLPNNIKILKCKIFYRERCMLMEIGQKKFNITASTECRKALRIGFEDNIYTIEPGETKEFKIKC